MFFFKSHEKIREVNRLIIAIVNHNCEHVQDLQEGPRGEGRVRLTLAVQVVPIESGKPRFDRTFPALTKEFSTTGISLAVDHALECEEVLIGISWEGQMRFIRATVRHQDPLGAGFWTSGLELTEMVESNAWRELSTISV